MKKSPHKAVIFLGFDSSVHSGTSHAPLAGAGGAAIQRAVTEALAAGLKELIFVTADSRTPVEAQLGDCGRGKAERVVIARQFAARSLGQALCDVRHLLGEEPFVVLLPEEMAAGGNTGGDEETTAQLVSAYDDVGGNLVTVGDEWLLRRDGRFAAIAGAPAGRYLLQPAVLDALEDNAELGLAGALLVLAEAWPVPALVATSAAALHPGVRVSLAPTGRPPRPVDLLAAAGD